MLVLGVLWGLVTANAASLVLRVDVRNITGPRGAGTLRSAEMRARLADASAIWSSQCGISFQPRSSRNVAASALGVPFEPRSEDDLSRLAAALNPDGFGGAIPVTIAGPWNFQNSTGGLWLHGLGWVFTDMTGEKVVRIGAMIALQKVRGANAGALLAHELGHALSLAHTDQNENVMAGGTKLTSTQCAQAHAFARASLREFSSF